MPENRIIIEIAKKISDLYAKYVEKDLQEISKEIKTNLEEIFYKNDFNYKLTFSNPVYQQKKIYSFIYRVKETKSLYEKLHRKNIVFALIEKFSILEQSDLNDDKIINELKTGSDFEDNIGFRILCDLEQDVKQCYALIKDNLYNFKDIKFDNKTKQPVDMKNGFPIYKIKCKYKEATPFELQIKSKLDSTWGDMEHDLYYKDNKIDIVKEINRISLSHIKKMLIQIDSYMLQLRDMHKNDINVDNIRILSKIENRYSEAVKLLLDDTFTFDFASISNELLFFVGQTIDARDNVNSINVYLDKILSSRKIRHDAWAVIILEAIYYENCSENEQEFINTYFKFICKSLGCAEELKQAILRIAFDIAIKEVRGSCHLLKMESYKKLEILMNSILDALSEEIADLDSDSDSDILLTYQNLFEYFWREYFGLSINDDSYDLEKINNIKQKIKSNGN